MKIQPEEVRRLAALAEVGVSDEELPTLVRQLDRIMEYVAQLDAQVGEGDEEPLIPGPAETPLRADEVHPAALDPPPAAMAPVWREGYFVVPRLSGMEEA